MRKKISAFTTAIILGIVISASFVHASSFTDIEDSYAKDAIIELQKKGILNGMDITHFDPQGTLTRAQFTTIIVKSLGLETNETTSTFKDVSDWAIPYIEAAYKAGIISGVGSGKFDPNATVTREMSATILVRALKTKGTLDENATLNFTDADKISDWAKPYIATAQKYGLIKGYPDGTFSPKGNANREMASVMGKNLLVTIDVVVNEPKPTSTPEPTSKPTSEPTATPTPTPTPTTIPTTYSGGGGYIPTATAIPTASPTATPTPVPDTTPPIITLIGNTTENVANGAVYTDAGATVSDNIDGVITANIVTTITNDMNVGTTFDSSVAATYTYHYNVSDAAVNAAIEVTRTVVVAAPVTLSSIAITTPAAKLAYTVGDILNISGMEVTGTYSDGSTAVETVTSTDVAGFDSTLATSSQILTVTVNGNTTTYTVTINVPLSSAKAIIAFDFATLSVTGVVDETAKTIALTVPNGTDVTALVATFTNSAASTVAVGGTAQTSGITANDFTSPVSYLITAEDTSTQAYTITVTVAADTTAPIAPTVNPVGDSDTVVTGSAEVDSTVTVSAGATTLGTGIADPVTGAYSITITAQVVGTSLSVTAIDFANNVSPPATVIVVDNTAPNTPIITTPPQSVNTSTITITGTSESDSTVNIMGGSSTATGIATSGAYSINVTLTANAINTLSVTATDTTGNVSSAATVDITQDSIMPVVTGVIEGGFYQTVSPTFNEGTATLNNGAYTSGTAIAGDSAQVLVVTDAAGNVTTVNFTTDNTAPTAPVAANISIADNTSPTVDTMSGIAGAIEGGATINVYSDATLTTLIGSATAAPDGSFAVIDLTDGIIGIITYYVVAIDATSNASTAASVSYTAAQ